MTSPASSTVTTAPTPILEVHDVHSYYGNIHALKGVTLSINEGEIVTLIGGNGAGKTTTLNTISGLLQPRSGRIVLGGRDLAGVPAHEIVVRGVVQVPEGRRTFARLTVEENLRMGGYTVSNRDEIRAGIERAYLLFPRLQERRQQVAGTLSGGEQQMLAIGRALMASPKVLLLDEPSMGLAPVLVELIFDTITRLHKDGTTILLVEQNARMALQIADRGYVIESGRIILADRADKLRDDPSVRKAYLGIT